MTNGRDVPRGDRNRNARLSRFRELVPVSNAIVGIDLADCKQMVVVTDHDSKVVARKRSAAGLGSRGGVGLGDRPGRRPWVHRGDGGCEPTRHRWRVLGHLAARWGLPFVGVQPMQTSWARPTSKPAWTS
jgi:hypothetical protein